MKIANILRLIARALNREKYIRFLILNLFIASKKKNKLIVKKDKNKTSL